MSLPITTLYAGVLGVLMAILSIRVPIRRGVLSVPFGDGGDEALATRIRAFGNFIEYVPMVLVLMALLELREVAPTYLHLAGLTLVASRSLHALAYRAKACLSTPEKLGRAASAMTTWLVLLALSLGALSVTGW